MGCDAVVCIELVEHLYPSNLSLFSKNVFGFLQPNIVILSTPNADFNQLFNLNGKYRHWDHKFEWNRAVFKKWCKNICNKYGFSVHFDGVGISPKYKSLGYCSQIAVFLKTKPFVQPCNDCKLTEHYLLVTKYIFPSRCILTQHIEKIRCKISVLAQNIVGACFEENELLKNKHSAQWSRAIQTYCARKKTIMCANTTNDTLDNEQFSDAETGNIVELTQTNTAAKVNSVKVCDNKKKFTRHWFSEEGHFKNPTDIIQSSSCKKSPLSSLFTSYFGKTSFMFIIKHSSLPENDPSMLNFCNSLTSVPILLFTKLLQFDCGTQEFL